MGDVVPESEPLNFHWQMDVSENSGTPKSSILIGFFIKNPPCWGNPIFGNTQMVVSIDDSHSLREKWMFHQTSIESLVVWGSRMQ